MSRHTLLSLLFGSQHRTVHHSPLLTRPSISHISLGRVICAIRTSEKALTDSTRLDSTRVRAQAEDMFLYVRRPCVL
jgi:hypothetical protein